MPQGFRFYFFVNPYENFGFVAVKFWFITVKSLSFRIQKAKILVHTGKKTIQFNLLQVSPRLKFFRQLSVEIQDKIKLKHLDFYSQIGTGDAAKTAMLTGVVAVAAKSIACKIKNFKPTATIDINAFSNFKTRVFEVTIYSKVSLSLFDFLYSVVVAWYKQKNT